MNPKTNIIGFIGRPAYGTDEYDEWVDKGRPRIPPSRKPVWIQRMQEGKLPNKDLTGKGPDAA